MAKQNKGELAPGHVWVKVRPHNNYSLDSQLFGSKFFGPGEVFQVPEDELKRVPHCLVSLDDEEKQEAAAKVKSQEQSEAQKLFDRLRTASLANAQQSAEALALTAAKKTEQAAEVQKKAEANAKK